MLIAALAFVTGTLTDKTTGQPLTGVMVSTAAGVRRFHGKTDARGRFTLGKLPDGSYTLQLSSADVPQQSVHVQVRGKTAHLALKACSTTLDYSCGGDGSPGGG